MRSRTNGTGSIGPLFDGMGSGMIYVSAQANERDSMQSMSGTFCVCQKNVPTVLLRDSARASAVFREATETKLSGERGWHSDGGQRRAMDGYSGRLFIHELLPLVEQRFRLRRDSSRWPKDVSAPAIDAPRENDRSHRPQSLQLFAPQS